mmetsp:Transcript_7640/g.11030  ORF Transcript_7640/g.11030 Transcript_7640/m.11030 type:complete len:112 (+) Transcript_7640:113-448(+)
MTLFTPRERITPSLCVTIIIHFDSFMADRSAPTTFFSLSESNAAVGSSNKRTSGFLINARAIATRCRWPPERDLPPSPIRVSNSKFRSLPDCTGNPASIKHDSTRRRSVSL